MTLQFEKTASGRLAWVENAYAILMFLVIVGHFCMYSRVRVSWLVPPDWFCILIYQFHMMAFVMLNGHLAKTSNFNKLYNRAMKKILPPIIIWSVLYLFFHDLFFSFSISLYDFEYGVWYLVSLFCWLLAIKPYVKFMKKIFGENPPEVLVAVLIGLSFGLIDIYNYMSIHRTIAFFPLFVFGYRFNFELFFERFDNLKYRGILVMMIFAFLSSLSIFLFVDRTISSVFNLTKAYVDQFCQVSFIEYGDLFFGVLIRVYVYIISIVLTLSFLLIVPKTTIKIGSIDITKTGGRRLYVYLLHFGLIVILAKVIQKTALFELGNRVLFLLESSVSFWLNDFAGLDLAATHTLFIANSLLSICLALCFAGAFCLILSSDFICSKASFFVEPYANIEKHRSIALKISIWNKFSKYFN